MKKLEKEIIEGRNIKKIIIFIALFITITLIIAFITFHNLNDKSYEIEDVKEFSYFKLYENQKYGVIDKKGNILVPPTYDILEIPNPSKPVFIGYINQEEEQTEVLNAKNEKILTQYLRNNTIYV